MPDDEIEDGPERWWEIRFSDADGDRIRIVDLPCGMLADVAEKHSVQWGSIVVDRPLWNIRVALDLLANAAAHLKVKVPDFETMKGADLQRYFELVEIDLPDPIEDDDEESGLDPTG